MTRRARLERRQFDVRAWTVCHTRMQRRVNVQPVSTRRTVLRRRAVRTFQTRDVARLAITCGRVLVIPQSRALLYLLELPVR